MGPITPDLHNVGETSSSVLLAWFLVFLETARELQLSGDPGERGSFPRRPDGVTSP